MFSFFFLGFILHTAEKWPGVPHFKQFLSNAGHFCFLISADAFSPCPVLPQYVHLLWSGLPVLGRVLARRRCRWGLSLHSSVSLSSSFLERMPTSCAKMYSVILFSVSSPSVSVAKARTFSWMLGSSSPAMMTWEHSLSL